MFFRRNAFPLWMGAVLHGATQMKTILAPFLVGFMDLGIPKFTQARFPPFEVLGGGGGLRQKTAPKRQL